jgi:DNA-binding NarL/FixJ family response regulator
MISIVIVDDHKIVRQGIHALLGSEPGFQVVGQAGDGVMALDLVKNLQPDVLISDLMMNGMTGIDVVRQVARICPKTKSLILSMYGDEAWVAGALEAGACGYVLKESSAEDLIQSIHTVIAGKTFLSLPLSMEKIESYRHSPKA